MARKTTTRNGIRQEDLRKDHDFAWALTQMKAGRTVVRERWLPTMTADSMGRSETHFVAFVPRRNGAPVGEDQRPLLTESTRDVLVEAHFVRGTILGMWVPGWTPTTEDLVAEDWGLGYREYSEYCGNWRRDSA